MSDTAQELDSWQASDGKWYPPQSTVTGAKPSLALLPQPPTQPVTLIPSAPIMEKKTYASPLSFVGATRRTTAWVRKVGTSTGKALAAWTAAVLWLTVMYTFLVFWYAVVFVLLLPITLPFRMIRRSQRKNQQIQEQQLATMQAMMIQQQQALAQQQRQQP